MDRRCRIVALVAAAIVQGAGVSGPVALTASPAADDTAAQADKSAPRGVRSETDPSWSSDSVEAPVPPFALTPDEINQLVQQLGEESFAVRRRAAQRLEAAGSAARQALLKGLEHPDAEVRRASRHVLGRVLDRDYRRRLQAFVADEDRKTGDSLAGWQRYREAVGDDASRRQLFIEMHRSERGLLFSAEAGDGAAAEALQLRFLQVYRDLWSPVRSERSEPSMGTIAALAFVSSDPALSLPEKLLDNPYWPQVILSTPFRQAMEHERYKRPARRLVGLWIARSTGERLIATKLRYAMQYDITEGLALGLKVMRDENRINPYYRAYGVMAVGQLGGMKYSRAIAERLDDRGECGRRAVNNNPRTVEIRDVALSWLIHLTGQSHADYGQPRAKAQFARMARNPGSYISTSSLGFRDGDTRRRALRKWKQWVADHPLPPLPEKAARIAKAADASKDEQDEEKVANSGLETADAAEAVGPLERDREKVRWLVEARELIETGRTLEAVRLLGTILSAEGEYGIREPPEERLTRNLKIEAESLIAALPPEGRRAYELQFGAEAEDLLQSALESGGTDGLRKAADTYFYTTAGAEAAYRLATFYQNRSRFDLAARYFEKLRNEPAQRDRREPQLSLKLAACRLLAGRRAMAKDVLEDLRSRYPNRAAAEALLAGKRWHEAAEQTEPTPGGWLMYRGGPTRNVVSPAGGPFLSGHRLPVLSSGRVGKNERFEAWKPKVDRPHGALPTLHAIVVGETLLLRTATRLRAVNLETGRLLWETPAAEDLRQLLERERDNSEDRLRDYIAEGLRYRLFRDRTFGTLSSDGRRVYCVEELAFGPWTRYRRTRLLRNGKQCLDPGWIKRYSVLSAYDIQTGKLVWEAGGPPFGSELPLAGAFFFGPPLPLGGSLYAIAGRDKRTRLVELDPETGRPEKETVLTEPGLSITLSMHAYLPFLNLQAVSRRIGLSPAAAEGILVCPTSGSRYVGVDPTTGRVRWVYRANPRDVSGGRSVRYYWERRIIKGFARDPSEDWMDASVTIANGRVLLTPRGVERLICLDLAEGYVQWTAPREDGLYVGGVWDEKVVVVGRHSIRAVRLADGKPAWNGRAIRYPDHAAVSGRGYLTEGTYFLPLAVARKGQLFAGPQPKDDGTPDVRTSGIPASAIRGQVAAVDLRQGTLRARIRSTGECVPENLVRYADSVISHGAGGAWSYDLLSRRASAVMAELSTRPDDPELLAERAEILISQGKLEDAVQLVSRPFGLEPDRRRQQLLVDALVDGLSRDVRKFRPLAEQAGQEIDDPAQKSRLLAQLAEALRDSGNLAAAMKTYLQLFDLESATAERDEAYFVAGRKVHRTRYHRARLEELLAAADADARRQMNEILRQRRQQADARAFVELFGGHPAADPMRLKAAEEAAQSDDWLRAEQLLLPVLESQGSREPEPLAAAAARMAVMLREAGRPAKAARYYRMLQEEFAEVACLDGKRGRELVSALPEDDPVRKWMQPERFWVGSVEVNRPQGRHGISNYEYPLPVRDCAAWARRGERPGRSHVENRADGIAPRAAARRLGSEMTISVNTSGRYLTIAHTDGRSPRRINLGSLSRSGAYNSSAMYSHGQAYVFGSLLVVWLGNRVCAVDLLDDGTDPLWLKNTFASDVKVPGMRMLPPQRLLSVRQAGALTGATRQSVALTGDTVCFQQGRKLLALDPSSGRTLWEVDHVPFDSDLFGGEGLLFVTPPESTEARVFRLADGHRLGIRAVPEIDARLTTLGRRVLTWRAGEQSARLTLLDPWSGETAWQHTFASGARCWLIDEAEVAVLDSTGKFTVLGLSGGESVVQAQLDRQPELDGVVVMRSEAGYVAIASRGGKVARTAAGRALPGDFPASGEVYGIDRATGQALWQRTIANQNVNACQPQSLPVMVFFNQNHRDRPGGHTTDDILCLDKRTGEPLLKESLPSAGRRYELIVEPGRGRIDLRTRTATFRLTFREGA